MNQKIVLGARVLLGLIFLIFGANGLAMFYATPFIPMPPPPPEMMEIMGGLMAMKYLLPLVKILEVIAGVLLLSGRYMNLALTLLAPIIVNILGIHLFAEPSGLPMAVIISLLFATLVKSRWSYYQPIFFTK